ncbi:hypothetical protein FE783_12595 [Paenibacillus mesophilus]|uniref:hypothetical protein n=1 Tax=Paenibacillus mesophilus TaxID=2582849 RepID=UPI00110DC29C|nr:hypothetical protein [Paenibacillus mesophilus]TMV49348.1 hypothetical protein FE783_12595 [Paenibacillus mesophilus]
MAMPMYKIRIIANACITRYDMGEREITDIVNSYNMATDDRNLVLAEIYAKRPDIETATPQA